MIFINDRFYFFLKALILGLLIIGALIFKGNLERLFIIAATLTIISIIRNNKFDFNYTLLIFLGLIIGYIIGNFLMYYSVQSNDISVIDRDDENSRKMSKTAVIIFSKGEPELFNLPIALKNIYNDNSIIKKINAPLEVFKVKTAYENIGISKNIDLCNRIRDDLKLRLGVEYDVYTAYFDIPPSVYEEIKLLEKQYDKLILVPLMLTESEEYKQFKKIVEGKQLNKDEHIKITPLLWQSQKLSKQILKKAIEMTDNERLDSTGAVLLMSDYYSIKEQNVFIEDIISKMGRVKFDKEIVICLKYDSSSEKLLSKSVKRLIERGADNILIISISNLQDDVRDIYEIKSLAEKIGKKEIVNIEYLNGWGIGEDLLNELEYKIRITNLKD